MAPVADMKISPKLIKTNTICADRPSLWGRNFNPSSWIALSLADAHCDIHLKK
jgi:hypothetical protein